MSNRRSEIWVPCAFSLALLVVLATGALASCGTEPTTPYGSSAGELRQYVDVIQDCAIEESGGEACCFETVSPQTYECPGSAQGEDAGASRRVKAACAASAGGLEIVQEEVDQLGNPYDPCAVGVTAHRYCRCSVKGE